MAWFKPTMTKWLGRNNWHVFDIINLKSILDIRDYQKNLDFSLIYKKIFRDFIYLSDRFIGI